MASDSSCVPRTSILRLQCERFICRFTAHLSWFLWALRATSRQTAVQSVMPLHPLRVFAFCGTPRLALLHLKCCLFSIGWRPCVNEKQTTFKKEKQLWQINQYSHAD
jgi:hypothetical protein